MSGAEMKPYYQDDAVTIYHSDCLIALQSLADNSVDSIVTDPPYGLAFMGKKWDYDVPSVEIWAECLRVLKPGGHLLAFAGTRTQHRMAVRIEDAGFEIRDMIAWVYGQGFSKSHNISKAIDKAAGAEREVVGSYTVTGTAAKDGRQGRASVKAENETSIGLTRLLDITAAATEDAKQWDGWGSALKPALEPITMARKPLDGTIAGNVLKHGVGGINVDGCRVEVTKEDAEFTAARVGYKKGAAHVAIVTPDENGHVPGQVYGKYKARPCSPLAHLNTGRFPANLILTYPEDQYMLRDNVTPDQLHKLAEWMSENAKR